MFSMTSLVNGCGDAQGHATAKLVTKHKESVEEFLTTNIALESGLIHHIWQHGPVDNDKDATLSNLNHNMRRPFYNLNHIMRPPFYSRSQKPCFIVYNYEQTETTPPKVTHLFFKSIETEVRPTSWSVYQKHFFVYS